MEKNNLVRSGMVAAICVGLAFPAPAVRAKAVDFTVKDANGADLRLSDYKGKVVLLNFWATYCVPCRTEIPWFIEFEKTYRDKGFAVVGISMDEEWGVVKPYLAEKKINYRIGLGNDELAQKYGGLDALPETFLIDREGKVVSRHVGMVSKADSEKDIVQALGK
jgi:thiol-disulfide isomerase/thioredoxin